SSGINNGFLTKIAQDIHGIKNLILEVNTCKINSKKVNKIMMPLV
ncbi:35414_t:CDS:1, partial [Gigaspora margarita]